MSQPKFKPTKRAARHHANIVRQCRENRSREWGGLRPPPGEWKKVAAKLQALDAEPNGIQCLINTWPHEFRPKESVRQWEARYTRANHDALMRDRLTFRQAVRQALEWGRADSKNWTTKTGRLLITTDPSINDPGIMVVALMANFPWKVHPRQPPVWE